MYFVVFSYKRKCVNVQESKNNVQELGNYNIVSSSVMTQLAHLSSILGKVLIIDQYDPKTCYANAQKE
jgi:hypothetical protein